VSILPKSHLYFFLTLLSAGKSLLIYMVSLILDNMIIRLRREMMFMKRILVILLSIISILVIGSVMNFIPKDYVSVVVYKNVAQNYSNLKNTTTFSFLLDTMGFEGLIKSMLQTQLLSYGLELDEFLDVFSNEIMTVTFENKDVCVVAGPSESAGKVVDALRDIISQTTGEGTSVVVEAYEGYVFIAGKKESIEKCKEGGGSIPKTFPESAWVISYSPSAKLEDMEFSAEGYSLFEDGKAISKGTIVPLNQSAREFLSNLEPIGGDLKDMVAGELTLYLNMKDPVTFLETLTKSLEGIAQEVQNEIPLEIKPPEEKEMKVLEDLKGKVHGLGYLALDFHEPLVEIMMGATEVTTQPKLKVSLKADVTSQDLEELFKSGEVSYERRGDYYLVENRFYVRAKGGYVNAYYPDPNVSFSPDALEKVKERMEGDESLLLYVDLSELIESLSGTQKEAYILLKLKVVDGKVNTSFILK